MERLKNSALFDDAGNVYVGFVLQTGGNDTTQTYLVAFAPDGSSFLGLQPQDYLQRSVSAHARVVGTSLARELRWPLRAAALDFGRVRASVTHRADETFRSLSSGCLPPSRAR